MKIDEFTYKNSHAKCKYCKYYQNNKCKVKGVVIFHPSLTRPCMSYVFDENKSGVYSLSDIKNKVKEYLWYFKGWGFDDYAMFIIVSIIIVLFISIFICCSLPCGILIKIMILNLIFDLLMILFIDIHNEDVYENKEHYEYFKQNVIGEGTSEFSCETFKERFVYEVKEGIIKLPDNLTLDEIIERW